MKLFALLVLFVSFNVHAETREERCEVLKREHAYLQSTYDRRDEMDYCDEHEDSDHCLLIEKFKCEVK